MKKIISLSIATLLSISMVSPIYAKTTVVTNPNVMLTNSYTPITFTNEVLNVDGTTFFPLRELLNNLGVIDKNITWNEATKTVVYTKGNYTGQFTIGSKSYFRNGVEYTMPVAPFIKDGKTYLPIRYAGDAVGIKVGYDEGLKQILVTDITHNYPVIYTLDDLLQFAEVQKGDQLAIIHTNYGDITMKLFPKQAPVTVEKFIMNVESGYYDGTPFYGIIPNNIIVAGNKTDDAFNYNNEVSINLLNFSGAVGMDATGEKLSTNEFYIVENDELSYEDKIAVTNFRNNPYELIEGEVFNEEFFPPIVADQYLKHGGIPTLDFSFTIFAQVIDGMDIVHKIGDTNVDSDYIATNPIIIESIDIITK